MSAYNEDPDNTEYDDVHDGTAVHQWYLDLTVARMHRASRYAEHDAIDYNVLVRLLSTLINTEHEHGMHRAHTRAAWECFHEELCAQLEALAASAHGE